jgi:flagellar basal body-associated protein FliL
MLKPRKEVNLMQNKTFSKLLALYLVFAMFLLTLPSQGWAMFVPATPHENATGAAAVSGGRTADLARIQAALESKIVQQKLMDYGLSPEETMARVNKLSDEQINQFATHTDALQAGGDRGGRLILILLIVILIILIVKAPGQTDRVSA